MFWGGQFLLLLSNRETRIANPWRAEAGPRAFGPSLVWTEQALTPLPGVGILGTGFHLDLLSPVLLDKLVHPLAQVSQERVGPQGAAGPLALLQLLLQQGEAVQQLVQDQGQGRAGALREAGQGNGGGGRGEGGLGAASLGRERGARTLVRSTMLMPGHRGRQYMVWGTMGQ